MSNSSVTLYANDSINLTTGVVTRNLPVEPLAARTVASRILSDSRVRVDRKNDLNALAYVIRNSA